MRILAPHLRASRQRGSVLLAALFIAMIVAGLAFGLLSESLSARANMVRSDTSVRALELAEAGLLRAEVRLAGLAGTASLDGAFGGGTYQVAVRDLPAEVAFRQNHKPDPLPIPPDMLAADAASKFRNRYWTWATGTVGQSTRTLEVHVRRWSTGLYREGMFAIYDLKFGGNSTTDAYTSVSADGTYSSYASQLAASTNYDAKGNKYVESGGDLGSNLGMITLMGSSTSVRGNAIPGDDKYVDLKGSVEITGDSTARTETRDIQPPPLSEFQNALAVGRGTTAPPGGTAGTQQTRWTSSKAVTYNATTMDLRVGSGTKLTLPGGSSRDTAIPYFFTRLDIGSNGILEIPAGQFVKIYITQEMTMAGTATLNNAGSPMQLEVLAHPYANLPSGFYPDASKLLIKLTGGSTSALSVYAPEFPFELHGGSDLYGAVIAKSITATGGVNFHYDKSLETLRQDAIARVERMYWAERSPPRR